MSATFTVGLNDVIEARRRIEPFMHDTPVLVSEGLDLRSGRHLLFKCENLQRSGSFKFRGACNAVMNLRAADAARGVVTGTGGNHAQALALAARLRRSKAHVILTRNAPPLVRQAVAELGAEIVECGPSRAAEQHAAAEVLARTGGTFIPAGDHPDVIAGQGTIAIELADQVGRVDAIVAPQGGGGLLAGVSIAARAVNPRVRLFAAVPKNSLGPGLAGDGESRSGELTTPILERHVERILMVSDDEVVAAMRLVWEHMRILIEPMSAAAVAAVLTHEFRGLLGINRVAVVLTGGNVDLTSLPWQRVRQTPSLVRMPVPRVEAPRRFALGGSRP